MNSAEHIVAILLEADPYAQGIKQAFDQMGGSTVLGAFHSYLAKVIQFANGDIQENELKQRLGFLTNSSRKLGVTADNDTMYNWLNPIISQSQFVKQNAHQFKGRSTATISESPQFKKWADAVLDFLKKQYPTTFFVKM